MDHYSYTNPGGHEPNCDVISVVEHDDSLFIVFCDGLNGMPSGDEAAKIISETAMGAFLEGEAPVEVCKTANRKFREMQFDNVDLRRAGSTICALQIKDGHCSWANVGDSRIYHFSQGRLADYSVDDSSVYREFERGEIPYEAIREREDRTGLLVCVGQIENIEPHSGEFDILSRDGIVVCSDGLWEHVYETEMLIDLHKSYNAKDWAQKMILRAVARDHLKGDNLSLITYLKLEG